jgi:hypothetical protein
MPTPPKRIGCLLRIFYTIRRHVLRRCSEKEWQQSLQRIVADFMLGAWNSKPETISRVWQKSQAEGHARRTRCLDTLKDMDGVKDLCSLGEQPSVRQGEPRDHGVVIVVPFDLGEDVQVLVHIPRNTFAKLALQAPTSMVFLSGLYYTVLGLGTGQFWGLTPDAYSAVQGRHKDAIECFASPWNSNLTRYFSPLPEMDSVFGSCGDFFEEIGRAKASMFVVNPPFTEALLVAAIEAVLSRSRADPAFVALVYLPDWRDLLGKYTASVAARRTLPKHASVVFDYTRQMRLVATFNTQLWLVTARKDLDAHVRLLEDVHRAMQLH